MRTIFKRGSVVFAVIVALLQATSLAAEEVRFASFNTYWLFDDKAPHKRWWDENRGAAGQTYADAIQLVASQIKDLNADVIALQEVEGKDVVEDLQERLQALGVNYPFAWVGEGSDHFTGQDVALLSKFPSTGNLALGFESERESYLTEYDPGNEDTTSLSKAMQVELDIQGTKVTVLVAHLKSQSGGAVADAQRLAQASLIRRITLPTLMANENLVVMGDLNADRGSKTLLRIRGFDDIFADLAQTTASDKFLGPKWTYEWDGRYQQIDHILLSDGLAKKLVSGEMFGTHDKLVSDHKPIVINLSF